jgi:hypothetical protein
MLNGMIRTRQRVTIRARAGYAVVALVLGFASAPLALAFQEPDVCSMACCVREGQCCCRPHHASVKRQASDGRLRISESYLTASCPEGCAAAVRSSKLAFRGHLRNCAQHAYGDELPIFLAPDIAIHNSIEAGSSSSRAPPVSSTI